ncbi:MAG: hypothetical protein LC713_03850 [Actinobacteria bacterium]|nr:hypothetical protein [Actinomycetota bacterium]
MDIEEFYDGDDRRRTSDELQFGEDWHDGHGRRYELNWIADTGEVFVMADDPPPVWSDPFGDLVSLRTGSDQLGVRVLTVIHDREDLTGRLEGWEEAMALPDGVAWLVERLFR